jgi:probable F420-dependent oxidoreductase
MQLGPIGIWAGQFRTGGRDDAVREINELEALGFDAVWVPGGGGNDILDVAADLLDATSTIVIASGILNIWMHEPNEVAESVHELEVGYPERFLLGLGVSHQHLVEQGTSRHYERPYSVMVEYLDALDNAAHAVPRASRALAALGPKMLDLAASRSLGAHPYCVPVAHTADARKRLGDAALLAPELKVVLERDPTRARAIARAHLDRYLSSPNYANNLLRLGYDQASLKDGGSAEVVDSLVCWGETGAVNERVPAHLDAGADHVCIQVLTTDNTKFPSSQWQALASALIS